MPVIWGVEVLLTPLLIDVCAFCHVEATEARKLVYKCVLLHVIVVVYCTPFNIIHSYKSVEFFFFGKLI